MSDVRRQGRKPVLRTKVLEAVLSRPAEGLTYKQVAEIVGEDTDTVRDALWRLRGAGKVCWLQRSRFMLHFGSAEYRDAFAASNAFKRAKSHVEKLREQRQERETAAIAAMQSMRETGASAEEVGKAIGVERTLARHLLTAMEREGRAWKCGTKNMHAWFASEADMQAAKPAVLAKMAARHAANVNKRRAGGRAAAARKPREKARPMRRDCSVIPSAPKPAQERKPVEIIGMDTAKFTPATPKPDHRYVVSQDHRGEFSSMGVGRYLE